ncbi:MAG: IPTL-CTERM sorting domain-containing protein [Deltaproteobacteria bacterium]|nr:IPTL-CTERM sorting domain-containing protein [Deltaproteobacteria bacterium]
MTFKRYSSGGIAALAALAFLILGVTAQATTPEQLAAEISGEENSPPGTVPVPDPDLHALALGMLPIDGLLLVPESTNDRVMAFDPMTGDLVDPDFIPADAANLSTPIHAILSADGLSILVSDQLEDVVQQYDLTGTFVGTFAPAGGVDNSILDNVRGIALRPNGNLLVTVGGGGNDDAVAEFDTAGNFLGNFVTIGAAGLDSPFDVLEISMGGGSLAVGEFLVGGITSDAIHHFDAAGAPLADLAPIDTFPEQLVQAANGNILIANFIGAQEGIMELDNTGALVGTYDPASLGGFRGVYELPNGNILTTNGGGVHEIDRAGNLVETKIAGVSGRFIQLVGGGAPPEPPTPVVEVPTLSTWGFLLLVVALLAGASFMLRRRRV